MRVNKSWDDYIARAVDLRYFAAISLEPCVSQSISRGSDGDDRSFQAQHGGVFDSAEFLQISSSPRASLR